MNHLVETNIPPLYKDWTLDQFVGADNIEEIVQKILKYLNDPELEKRGNNLYVYSVENGTGKTSIAYYILGEIHKPRVTKNGTQVILTPIVAVKFANYLKLCNDPFDLNSKAALKLIETAPFLLIDDVSPWALTASRQKDKKELVLLMMYRREHLLPTIITSNLVPAEFDKTFGSTVASKVLENFSYIEVRGGDVRQAIYPDTLATEEEILEGDHDMEHEIQYLKEIGEH